MPELSSGKVLIRTRLIWLAWYPLRGRRSQIGRDSVVAGGWHWSAAMGPLYLGVGTGVPLP